MAKSGNPDQAKVLEEIRRGEQKLGSTVWEEHRSFSQTVKLCSKAYLHGHKGETMAGWENQVIVFLGYIVGCRRKAVHDHRRLILKHLGEETKVEQEEFW